MYPADTGDHASDRRDQDCFKVSSPYERISRYVMEFIIIRNIGTSKTKGSIPVFAATCLINVLTQDLGIVFLPLNLPNKEFPTIVPSVDINRTMS